MSIPIPKNETKRLKVLWQYDVLDTVPEEVFDNLTDLAAKICEAPIALISLVDEKRQWFKSKVGLSVDETARDRSFCSHAIMQNDLFIVPDAAQDPRFARNPMVTSDPKIRFYAGAPLVTPDGHALGTLCIIDKVPRELRSHQKQALRILAHHVVSQLELRRHARELTQAHQNGDERRAELAKVQAEIVRLRAQVSKLKARRPKAKRKPPGKSRR
jgi:GAF domain-containing protein